MEFEQAHDDHLTDYERAVCYYTLPRVTSPVAAGAILLYAALAVGLLVVFASALRAENEEAARAAGVILVVTVLAGTSAFFVRATINAVRRRKALETAHGLPDAESSFDEVPDPFAEHVLLRKLWRGDGREFGVWDKKGRGRYRVTVTDDGSRYTVEAPDEQTPIEVSVTRATPSFSFDRAPGEMRVSTSNGGRWTVRKKFSLGTSPVIVSADSGDEPDHDVRLFGGGLYRGDKLVGRIYTVRQSMYLDVQRTHFSPGVLALFVVAR